LTGVGSTDASMRCKQQIQRLTVVYRVVFEDVFGAQACSIPPACISRIDVTCFAALGYRRENPFAEFLRPTCTRNIIIGD